MNRFMSIIFAILGLILCNITKAESIKGRIVDDASQPIAFANVILLNHQDSSFIQGTVSKNDGSFVINAEYNEGLLKVSAVGYKTEFREIKLGETLTIPLQPETYSIKGVVVKGKRPQYQMDGNGLTVNVLGTMLSEAGTANDVIGLLPGVQGGNGRFTVMGKGRPLIYVNGRMLHNTAELDRLSSKDIVNIELDNTPGAKYSAKIGAVIRIKTIKRTGDGWSGSGRVLVRQGHYSSENEQLSMNYHRGRIDMFAEAAHGSSHSYQKQVDRNESVTSTDLWNDYQRFLIKDKGSRLSFVFGTNYQINQNNSFGVRYTMSNDLLGSKTDIPMEETVSKNTIQIESIQSNLETKRSQPFAHLLNTYYNGKIGKLSIDFNTDYYYKGSRIFQNIKETDQDLSERTVKNHSRQRSEMLASKLILGYPVAKGKLEGGYEYIHTDRKDHYLDEVLMPSSNNMIEEQTIAGFVSFNCPIKKVNLSIGLRYEHVSSDYYDFGVFSPEQSRTYDRLFPNVNIVFPIKKAKFALSYSEKTARPSYSQLRSFVQYDSRYLYETGNPLLRPAIHHDISLSGTYKSVYISLSYKRTDDHIASEYVPYKPDSPISLIREVNFDHLTSFTAVASFSQKIGCWSPTWRIMMYMQSYKLETTDGTHKFNTPQIHPQWDNFFSIGKNFILYAAASGQTAGDYQTLRQKESWKINLGGTYKMKKWNFRIYAYDIFRTARNSKIYYGYSCMINKWNYYDSHNIQLTVTYRFNTTRSKYKGAGAGNEEKNRL